VESFLAPVREERQEDSFEMRMVELTGYQSAAYAQQYQQFVESVAARAPELRETVARYLYKLMAYKDEYEVARLLTKPDFEHRLRQTWASVEEIGYSLHPPLLRRLGLNRKLQLGAWFRLPLRLLATMKFLRGTPLDGFGYSAHRRRERALIDWYRGLIEETLRHLTPDKLSLALEIAALPDQIRGYERIKEDSIRRVKKAAEEKLAALRTGMAVVS
jgi:indolepyruvate ferredoxin oxidoreductase